MSPQKVSNYCVDNSSVLGFFSKNPFEIKFLKKIEKMIEKVIEKMIKKIRNFSKKNEKRARTRSLERVYRSACLPKLAQASPR
jgi:hypothetical protein